MEWSSLKSRVLNKKKMVKKYYAGDIRVMKKKMCGKSDLGMRVLGWELVEILNRALRLGDI